MSKHLGATNTSKLIACLIFFGGFAFSQCATSDDDYFVKRKLAEGQEIHDPELIDQMKNQLSNQISSFIDSSVSISSSKKMNSRGKKKSKSNFNYVSRALIINPKINVCGDIVIMSLNKETYKKELYKYFKTNLDFDSSSLNNFLSIGYLDDKKLLKQKVAEYRNKLNVTTSMLPLVNLSDEDNRQLNQFVRDLTILEKKYEELRASQRLNFGKLGSKISKGINDLID